jgi:hypothetical protein
MPKVSRLGAYVEHLVFEEDARCIRVAAFEQAVGERLRSLRGGESVDGEEVMARLIAEVDEPGQISTTR